MAKTESPDNKPMRVGQDAPAWLVEQAKDDKSVEGLQQYRVIPRVQILQELSDKKLVERHGVGTAITIPGQQEVMGKDRPVLLVPVFQFTEFVTWYDRNDREQDFPIKERTFNSESDLAKRARDPEAREERYGPKDKDGFPRFVMQHCEQINFVCVIYGAHPLAGTPVGLVFTRGEFQQGQNFCTAIMTRRVGGQQAPLWSQVWQFSVEQHTNRNGDSWWGFEFEQPEEPWIEQEDAEDFRKLYEETREHFAERRLAVEIEDGGGRAEDSEVSADGDSEEL